MAIHPEKGITPLSGRKKYKNLSRLRNNPRRKEEFHSGSRKRAKEKALDKQCIIHYSI
jgi:hypothetical protein